MQRITKTYRKYLARFLSIFEKSNSSEQSESHQMSDKPSEVLENCIICDKQQSDVVFDCGHISTCEQCTFIDNICRICNKVTKERLIVKYDENIRGITLDVLEKSDE